MSNNEQLQEHKELGQENDYSLFDFFSNHTNLLIACVSGLFASLAILITAGLYIRDSVSLHYWNISESFIDVSNRNRLYSGGLIFGASILMSLFSIYSVYVFLSFNSYLPYIANANKNIRNLKQRIPSDDKELWSEFNRVKKDVRKLNYLSYRTLLKNYIFPALLIIGLITTLYQNSITKTIDLLAIVLIVFFVPFFLNLSLSLISYYKTYKSIDESADLNIDDIKKYPLENIRDVNLKELFSDTAVKMQVLTITLLLFSSFLTFSNSNYFNVKSQKTFPIVSTSDSVEAIVYQNSDYAVLEKAVIIDNTIVIRTEKQRIISIDNLEYELETFDKVYKHSNSIKTSNKV